MSAADRGAAYDYNDFRNLVDAYAKGDVMTEDERERILRILRGLPKQEKGMNTERVKRFLDKQNLRQSEFFIIHSVDIPQELRSKFEKNDSPIGLYASNIDAVIVLRDELEKLHLPTEGVEGVLVHELVHSSGKRDGFRQLQESGQLHGTFFEEGFADLIEHEYFAQHGDIQDIKARTSSNTITMNSVFVAGRVMAHTNVPPPNQVQAYVDAKRSLIGYRSRYAGFGLELLCKAIPTLKNTFIKGRTNPQFLKQALSLIDKHFPSLSEKLMELQETDADFAKGNSLIIQAIYGRNEVVVNPHAEPIVQNVTSLRYKISKALGKKMPY